LKGKDHQSLSFAFPGSLATRTGGYIYDARIIDELRATGITVRGVALPASFPAPGDADRAIAERQLGALPPGEPLIIDGLAFGVMDELAAAIARRRRLVALVHHPLAYETGLSAARMQEFARSETRALAHAAAVVVTSPSTGRLLVDAFGVPNARITVAPPGTERRPPVAPRSDPQPRLLAVGSIVPRKDFATLVDALAQLRDLPWQATIAGSDQRDAACATALRRLIADHRLDDRIALVGELPQDALEQHYRSAAVFVSSARYEGYGMAMMDAIAFGLPVVATSGGAVAEVAPAQASLLSPPGDAAALADHLRSIVTDFDLRQRLAAAAREARERLPSWRDAASLVTKAVFG